MPKKKSSTPKLPTPVDSHKHKDRRANIPTEELRDFIAEEEKAPKTMLYPRVCTGLSTYLSASSDF